MLNKLKSFLNKINRRMILFIIIFIVFGTSNYFFDYVFRPSKVDLLREFSIAFGLAFGISYANVIFFKKRKLK